jgi:hypothetical protein
VQTKKSRNTGRRYFLNVRRNRLCRNVGSNCGHPDAKGTLFDVDGLAIVKTVSETRAVGDRIWCHVDSTPLRTYQAVSVSPANVALQPRRARSFYRSQDDTRAVGCKRSLGGHGFVVFWITSATIFDA